WQSPGGKTLYSLEKYRQKFRAARWAGRVRPRAFAQKLMDWATRWLRPNALTVGQIMDRVVLEQFLQGLPDSVWVLVRRHQPATLEAAVQRTEEYAETDFPAREPRALRDPEGLGHKSRDCPVMECGAAYFCGWAWSATRKGRHGLDAVPVRVGRKPHQGLVDTASAHSFVQKNLVKPHSLIPGNRMCKHPGLREER
uniref:SCAN box domain-containing protein n=1 Tax=Chelonoidis abingdonii TaxID=106734 RepID=A0A8C0GML7_CHEAB